MISWLSAHFLEVIGAGVLLAGVAYVSVQVDRQFRNVPQREPPPETLRVDGEKPPPDTVKEIVPKYVEVHDTIENTRLDTVYYPKPVDMTVQGLIPPSPVRYDDGEFRLRYFDPEARRWTVNRYEVPQPTWRLWPSAGLYSTPQGLGADVSAHLRYKKVEGRIGYAQIGPKRGLVVGVRVRPFTWTFGR